MGMETIHRCAAAIDVHQAKLTVCIQIEDEQGEVETHLQEFGGFKRDRIAMAEWIASFNPDCVVMESTGIYWKSPYAFLEKVGIFALVVNARHVKNVPGRKTDLADAQWLATLARSGLLNGSFIPPKDLRELRLVSRQMQNLTDDLAGEKNRLHKILVDSGIRLSVVVSDINGVAAREMIEALLDGKMPQEILKIVNTQRLRASEEELLDALEGDISENHRFVLLKTIKHIEYLEKSLNEFRAQLLQQLKPHQAALEIMQTIPGLDINGAAMLLVEIGDDMDVFGSAEKLSSWAGVCPGNNESAGKHKKGKQRKGNKYVRRILCEAAHAASRTQCALQDKFKSLLVRRGRKRAIFALAHKILKIIFVLISRGEGYRDATVDYEEMMVKRNAPRWFKMLQKYGYV